MSSSPTNDVAIGVHGLSKCYHIYDNPSDRLKQFVWPRIQRSLHLQQSQYFREFWALQDVTFEIKRGETVGIIGRNGSGKSTLLQIICGTLHPSNGRVHTSGRVAALLELGSGFNPEFTGRENVFLNASVLGLTQDRIKQRFADIEAFADIGQFIDQPVKTYSSGMLVRLAFAVIAHVDADILVIDEALAVGDAFFTQKCMRYLRNFMRTGTVLFVSHDTSAVKALCTRAIWLDHGKLLQDGTPKEICDQYLQAYYEQQQADLVQNTGVAEAEPPAPAPKPLEFPHTGLATPRHDQRLPWLNASNLRNDLRIFQFDPEQPSFGLGGSRVEHVEICDAHNRPLSWVVGGEDVVLWVQAKALQDIARPIVGFIVKDRLGQGLFGDNTYLTYEAQPVQCSAGQRFEARFHFQMPRLPSGDYSVTIAVADGTQQDHVQHQWIFDALTFKSEATSASAGLIGIPMTTISLSIHPV